jgi:hypothetical protein
MQRAHGTVRGTRRHAAPSLSVIVASPRWTATLGSTVATLASQFEGAGVEVIVVCPSAGSASRSTGNVRYLDAAGVQGVEELRALGMRSAGGDIVVMADPARLSGTVAGRAEAIHP